MEESIPLKTLGTPLHVVVRIRKPLVGEVMLVFSVSCVEKKKKPVEGDVTVSGNSKRIALVPPSGKGLEQSQFVFDYVYVPDTSSDEIYERTISPALLTVFFLYTWPSIRRLIFDF